MPLLNLSSGRLSRFLAIARPNRAPSAAILGIAEEITRLTAAGERDFLAVGARLMEFRSSARQIASDLSALAGAAAGGEGRQASAALDRALGHARRLHGHIEQSGQSLENVRCHAASLRSAFAGLPGVVTTLRALCTLTRIETARLGKASGGFASFAEEVGPLSENIQQAGEEALDAASCLQHGVETTLSAAAGIRSRQLRDLPRLLDAVSEGMNQFAAQQVLAAEASARQAAAYEALSAAIDDLVRALQFHDITRQQVEHSLDALHTAKAPSRPLVLLQAAQLRAAAGTFAAAVHGIESDLASIAARLEGMSAGGGSLPADSFFESMKTRFGAIIHSLQECSRAGDEMRACSQAVERPLAAMRESVAAIGRLEIGVQRIALNASIRAVHIGAPGDSLAVIATRMQEAAVSSAENTVRAAASLDAVERAVGLFPGEEALSAATASSCTDLEECNRDLQAAGERAQKEAREIAASVAVLQAGIAEARRGLESARVFASALDRAAASLETIATDLPGESSDSSVAALAERYTMHSERVIHHEALGGAPSGPVEPLGENVELF